ncbi:hypothetical protein [Acinetobacter nosocomialis]|uniref:hypothetical protein n=1 Tax=Acinetobacter nosocomialis TaxID=106654 RepID=UPI0024DE33D2|nr:hypothetical protein [Acinetobacter nosocomialis]HAV5966184.1 hypothetical protein [Acinetobacter baumannii]HAV5968560.1 hypothetical protein [Acinetobacter baumannii]
MTVLGINLEKSGLRYAVLDGTKDSPILIHADKINSPNFSSIPQQMNWYETTIQNILTRFNPSQIGIKVSLDAKRDSIAPWYYPLGLLHQQAFQQGITTTEYVSANFTPSKFGLDKTVKIYDYIDSIFGIFTPKWDKNQKYAVLSAWMILP